MTALPPAIASVVEAATPLVSLKKNGCKGDGRYVLDAAITAGTAGLSSTTAAFTAADAGKVIFVVGAGTPQSVATSSGALSTGAPITSLPVNALAAAIPQGEVTIFSADGLHSQKFVTTGAAAAATSIPVTSQAPNFAYASGSTIGYPECLSTSIASVSGGVATLAANAVTSVTGATACFGTDDTAAVRAAIDNLAANGQGGVAVAEDGVYCIAGALRSAASSGNNLAGGLAYRTQIPLPAQDQTKAPKLVIVLTGGKPAGGDPEMATGLQDKGAIFQSFLVGLTGAGGLPSMFGGPLGPATGAGGITNLHFEPRNVTLRTPSNPSIAAADLRCLQTAATRDVRVDTTETPAAYEAGSYPAQPTRPSGQGFLFPAIFGQNGRAHGDLFITGYYAGLGMGEHTEIDYVYVLQCYLGISLSPVAHASIGTHINVEHCPHVLGYADPIGGLGTIGGGTIYTLMTLLDIEDSTSSITPLWTTAVDHVNDPQNRIQGTLNYHRVTANVGAVAAGTPLTFVGGSQRLFTMNDGRPMIWAPFVTTATAGGASALPAAPAVYFVVYDNTGAKRLVPGYNP